MKEKIEKDSIDYENGNQIHSLHAQTRCRSVHARGFTAGQKIVENQDLATGPPGRRGPWAVGRRAAGPLGRGAAFSKTRVRML